MALATPAFWYEDISNVVKNVPHRHQMTLGLARQFSLSGGYGTP